MGRERVRQIRLSLYKYSIFVIPCVIISLGGVIDSTARAATVACGETRSINEAEWSTLEFAKLRSQGVKRPDTPVCRVALLRGAIAPGDASNFLALVRKNIPFLDILALDSLGGDLHEGMAIGRIAHNYLMRTEAPYIVPDTDKSFILSLSGTDRRPPDGCFSACFFLWLGGVGHIGNQLGIHRPVPSDAEMHALSPDQAERLYSSVGNEIRSYLSDVSASPDWLDKVMRVPSGDVHLLRPEELSGVTTSEDGGLYSGDIPSLAEWKTALCGAMLGPEVTQRIDLAFKEATTGVKLSQAEIDRLRFLNGRVEELVQCSFGALRSARLNVYRNTR